VFLAKSCGLDASPALTTVFMFAGAAEANTSAGAPLVISVAKPELGPKLNFTVSPGWAASNCFPSWVKVPISDAAANTVMAPVADAGLLALPVADGDAGVLVLLLLEQPARAHAPSAAATAVNRRTMASWVESRRSRTS
jgi:hypothetical protein